MQEEVENRTINLAISTTKLTGRTIVAGIRKYLQHREKVKAQKARDPAVHGKQTVKQLLAQNQGATNVEIDKSGIKDFERLAKKYGLTISKGVFPQKRTQRDDLCEAIDTVLKQKPKSFEDFIQALADSGFELKDGNQPAFKGKDQKRFIRLRSLGEGYSKEELQAVISGKSLHRSKGTSVKAPAQKQFQMLIDVQAKMAEGKTVGYEKWAKKFNRKEAARTVILLKEKGLGNYDDLTAHIEKLSSRFDELSDSIKTAEKRIVEVQALLKHMDNYYDTREIYVEYRKSGYSKKFFEEHRQEITHHKAAKKAFDEMNLKKLPSRKSLYEEFYQLTAQKKKDYAEYRQVRKEKEELLIAKQTVETILNIDKKKEQEKEKEKDKKTIR